MRDLWIHNDDLLLGTHGRSFWVLDDITPLRQLAVVANAAIYLFKPASAYRVRRDTNSDTPLPPDEPAGQNPPDGAIIDYALGKAATGPVTLEIMDATGKPIHRYSSDDKPPFTFDTLGQTLTVPTYWVRPPATLSTAAGMHRFVWDLHETPPESSGYGYPISAVPHDTPREPLGPSVLPGRYTVRLSASGHTVTTELNVVMDPRIKTPVAGLRQQYKIQSQLVALMNANFDAQAEVRGLDHQLEALSKKASGPMADAVAALRKKVAAIARGHTESPAPASKQITLASVTGDLGEVYGAIGSADTAPTALQTAALATVEKENADVMARWQAIKSTDLPALNRQLSGAGIEVIELKPDLEPAAESENEE
jgi:hypothetical protein